MSELCQMWERREGGTPFPLLPKAKGDPLARPAARAGVAGMPPLAPVERDNLGVTPDPRCGFGGGVGGWVPLATPPLSPPSNPALFPARREEEEQGQGPAGRQAGRRAPGRAGAACHVGGAALPGCLCVPVPLQWPGQGVSREEEAGQLCRGEVAGSPPFSFSLFQLHLGWAACRAPAIPASSCRRAWPEGYQPEGPAPRNSLPLPRSRAA